MHVKDIEQCLALNNLLLLLLLSEYINSSNSRGKCFFFNFVYLLLPVRLLLWDRGSRGVGSVAGHGLNCLCHVESSLSRDQTRVPCIGKWIFSHWTTREVQVKFFF